jgi:hypothetical protein
MATSFECPSCGAALEPPTTPAVSVTCHYCGTVVPVPDDLRVHPAAAPAPTQPEGITINIGSPQDSTGRPQVTFNVPPEEIAQLQKVEAAMQTSRRTRRGFLGCGGCGCLSSLLFVAACGAFMIMVFGYSIKGSILYQCSVQKAQSNPGVVKLIGTPIKADTFAWITDYKSSGSRESGHFTTGLSGPKGSGTLDVTGTHDDSTNTTQLNATFAADGQRVRVNSGAAKCE